MTAPEVDELVAGILDRWPHAKISLGAISQYGRDLAEVLHEHAAIAVETWYRDGERFAPSGAEILGRVAELALDIPDWGTVKAGLDRQRLNAGGRHWTAGRTCPVGECDGRGIVVDDEARTSRYCACRDEIAAEAIARQATHPVVAVFLEKVGQRELADVLDGDRTAEAQVRNKYEALRGEIRRQVVFRGIPAGGLRGMERLALEAAERLPTLLGDGAERIRAPRQLGAAIHQLTERTR